MSVGFVVAIATSSFLCGVALMYLVMMRTIKKRIAEGSYTPA